MSSWVIEGQRTATETPMSCPTYRPVFTKWNNASWIRSKPIRSGAFEGSPFSACLVPTTDHPAVAVEGSPELKQRLLAFHLLAHLHFTTVLELNHINQVCSSLSQGVSPVELGTEQRLDALRIYCDEGGHALFVEDLARSVERTFRVERSALGRPAFERRLDELVSEHQGVVSPALIRCFFVAISETLVTRILNEIPRDPDVAGVVRAVIADHAADEALHSAYFQWYFPRLWHALSGKQRTAVGAILPELVWIFLAPDQDAERAMLRAVGLRADRADAVVADTYDPQAVAAAVRQAARPTLRMFRDAGVLRSPGVEDAFARRHLLSSDAAPSEAA